MRILLYMGGGFDTYGPSNHLYRALIIDLLNAKHYVHLIESHSTGESSDIPEEIKMYNNFSYETVKLDNVPKKKFAKRYLAGVKYCFRCIPKLKKQRKKYDVMMVQSCPWAPFAIFFSKVFVKIPIIWNIQDMFPGASIANGAMSKKWMQRFFFKFHKIAYKNADFITVISEDMKKKVIEQGVSESKIEVIPDWYDDQSVFEIPWKENLFVKKYKMQKDKFYVQYAGTMGYNFDYKLVVEVAKILKNQKDIIFQMIGQGSQKEDFMNEVAKSCLHNIVFYPLEPREMVPHVYSACSICLIPLPIGVIGNSVPSKAGLLMACHRVIVNSVDVDSNYYKMFENNQIGISASNKNPMDVANAILLIKNNDNLRMKFADNAKEFAKKYYSRKINTKKYENLYKKISKEIKK